VLQREIFIVPYIHSLFLITLIYKKLYLPLLFCCPVVSVHLAAKRYMYVKKKKYYSLNRPTAHENITLLKLNESLYQ